jgi:2-iminoacetate synthase
MKRQIREEIGEAEKIFHAYDGKASREELSTIIAKDYIDRVDYLKLLSSDDLDVLELMARSARDLTERFFGKMILLYAPLYLSDYCTNGCIYCGYSTMNASHGRKRLGIDEMRAEMSALKQAGFDSILLLTGGDRERSSVDYIADAVKTASAYFSEILLEIYALTTDEYEKVFTAGGSGLALYQETYDRDLYDKVHLCGEKKNYDFRLEAPERAIEAGLKHINIGPLLGLGSAVHDMFLAAVHGNYLLDRYPEVELCLSYPRLRPAGTLSVSADPVDDARFIRFILATRLFLHRAGISISTRERAHIRDNLVGLGMTRMSAGSRTTVGGYAAPSTRTGQFEIDDDRTVEEISGMIKSRGYRPEFTNWIKGLI